MKAVFPGLFALVLLAYLHPAAGQSGEAYYRSYEEAARSFSEGDYATATIHLKNALQNNPVHLPSRILLGRIHLLNGDAKGAEKELTIAENLGASDDLIMEPLGNALLVQGKHEEILARIAGRTATGLSLRGQAHLELGELADADHDFSRAEALAPNSLEPLLGRASVLLAEGRLAEAEELVDEAIDREQTNGEAWYRKGLVRQAARDPEGALAAFDRALEYQPGHMRAHLARARVRLQLGDLQGALDDAQQVRESNEDDAHAAFLVARILSRLGDAEGSRAAFDDAASRIGRIKPESLARHAGTLYLAAVIGFAQGNYEKANFLLTEYLKSRPYNLHAQKLLARAKLQIGDAKGAIAVLQPLARNHGEDSEALMLLGDAYLRDGWYDYALQSFEAASAQGANDEALVTQLALSRIGAGRGDEAIAELEEDFRQDGGTLRGGVLLAFIQARRGDFDTAVATAEQLIERNPDNAFLHNLLGSVQRSAGKFDAARAAFEEALKIDPGFGPARFNLAALELQAGDVAAATRRYREIYEQDPKATRALTGLADIALAQGDSEGAIGWLHKAITLDPGMVSAQTRLIGLYLETGKTSLALAAADAFYGARPEQPEALELLARAQIASDRQDAAVASLRNAVRYSGYDSERLLRIARIQVDLADFEGARWTLQKALETGRSDDATAALVRLDIYQGRLEAAMEQVKGFLEEHPDEALGHILSGDVQMAGKRYPQALEAYDAALDIDDGTAAALGKYRALSANRQPDEALDFLEGWSAAHPDDLRAKRAIALDYLRRHRLDEALALHEELLEKQPGDALLLNNLARLYQLRNDPRARRVAEAAVEQAPESALTLDTLGWILVTEGEPAAGLRLLRDAYSRGSTNPLIRYHVAAALAELGREREAISELEGIMASRSKPRWIGDVRALYSTLTGKVMESTDDAPQSVGTDSGRTEAPVEDRPATAGPVAGSAPEPVSFSDVAGESTHPGLSFTKLRPRTVNTGDGGVTWSALALAASPVEEPPGGTESKTRPVTFGEVVGGMTRSGLTFGDERPRTARKGDGGVTWSTFEKEEPADPVH